MGHGYITLISNGVESQKLYPNNTVANFTIKLHESVTLHGEHEMSLKEVMFPISFFNVTEREYHVDITVRGVIPGQSKMTAFELPAGNYTHVSQLLKFLNNIQMLQGGFRLKHDLLTGHMHVENSSDFSVDFSPKLRRMLGFGLNQPIDSPVPNSNGIGYVAGFRKGEGMHPVNLYINVPQQLFFYCDLIEPQLVGDTSSQLMRIIGIEDVTKYGHLFIKIYDNPDYYPMLKTNFTTVTCDFRTAADEPAPFEFGPSIVKVHYRPVSS